jgi:hypothetical protein
MDLIAVLQFLQQILVMDLLGEYYQHHLHYHIFHLHHHQSHRLYLPLEMHHHLRHLRMLLLKILNLNQNFQEFDLLVLQLLL